MHVTANNPTKGNAVVFVSPLAWWVECFPMVREIGVLSLGRVIPKTWKNGTWRDLTEHPAL